MKYDGAYLPTQLVGANKRFYTVGHTNPCKILEDDAYLESDTTVEKKQKTS